MRARLVAVILLGAMLVGTAQPYVDRTRGARAADSALVFVPDGDMLKVAASGVHEPVADLLWVRVGLVFGERWAASGAPDGAGPWTVWLGSTLEAIHVLDPRWRTAYYHGALMQRVLGDIDGSDATLRRAMDALPQDWFFPFNLGMNHYLYRDDPAEAARWITHAASLPGAPNWYAAAAAAMAEDAGQRETAIRYLEEVLANARDPMLISDTTNKLQRLRHNRLVAQWEDLCRRFRDEHGRALAAPAELESLAGQTLPPNPRGDAWVVGRDGVVRGQGAERDRVRRAQKGEWKLAGR